MSFPSIPRDDPRMRSSFPLCETGFHRLAVKLVNAAFRPLMVTEVNGLENLPREGGVILAANHLTGYDVFPLQLGLPRAVFYMGKAELFRLPAGGWLLKNLCAFPVHRGEGDQWALEHAARILRAGQVVGIFPEGTRSRGAGLRMAKTGAARLAIETRCPVVPVAMDGSHRFFADFPRRTRVRMTLCTPVYAHEGDDARSLTARIMRVLAENLPPGLRGVYGRAPAVVLD